MKQSDLIRAAVPILLAAGVAGAQPFVHNIGENEGSEHTRDLTALLEGNIAVISHTQVGPNAPLDAHLVIHDADGMPLRSWFFTDPASKFFGEEPQAIREDPANLQLIQLFTSNVPANHDLLMFDPGSSAITWQWRYLMENNGWRLGMELDGPTGLVAASITPPQNDAQPTLLRFSRATGLPVFYTRYDAFNTEARGLRFVDVTSFTDETGRGGVNDVFAVGTVEQLLAPDFTPGMSKLIIARFDFNGNPAWFRAYDANILDQNEVNLEGASIELDRNGGVNVTARTSIDGVGPAVFNLKVAQATGNPITATLVGVPGGRLEVARSSLELLPNDTLLVSGTLTTPDGVQTPSMWTLKVPNLFPDWFWASDSVGGTGQGAVLQPNDGALLAGDAGFTANGPIGGQYLDILLARTDLTGDGLCPLIPDLQVIEPPVQFIDIPVEPITMPPPLKIQLEVRDGKPRFDLVCDKVPCPGDLTTTGTAPGDPGFGVPDCVTNLSDLLFFTNAWNNDLGTPSPNPGSLADVTTTGTNMGDPGFGVPDGNVDLSDLLFYVNLWNQGIMICP